MLASSNRSGVHLVQRHKDERASQKNYSTLCIKSDLPDREERATLHSQKLAVELLESFSWSSSRGCETKKVSWLQIHRLSKVSKGGSVKRSSNVLH